MRVVLIGIANSAEQALLGLIESGAHICGIFTNDLAQIISQSRMGAEYFSDLGPYAKQIGCPLYIVENLSEHFSQIRECKPDLIVAIGWPHLIDKTITSSFLCIGMHPTILPERRGGAPLNWQIIDGISQSAVSIIQLQDGVDSGDILIQNHYTITEQDYISDVMKKVCEITKLAVAEAYSKLLTGKPEWIKQREELATYTRRRKPVDGLVFWKDSSIRIYNFIRAISDPFPGAYTFIGNEMVKIWRSQIPLGFRAKITSNPGEILGCEQNGILISTRDNAIALTQVEYKGHMYKGNEMKILFNMLYEFRKCGDE